MGATLRIEIFPADLDASVGFYERLGFELVGIKDGPPRYASMRWDDVRIGMRQSDAADPTLRAIPVGTEIVIDVDDVQAVRDHALGCGITPVEDLTEREWGLTDFRVTDPDGYYLRITGRR